MLSGSTVQAAVTVPMRTNQISFGRIRGLFWVISTIDIYRAYQRFSLGDIYYGYLLDVSEVFSG